MALNRLEIDGYGQVEINKCAFRATGRIEAQSKPDSTDFAEMPVENGLILAIDPETRTVKLPGTDTNYLYGLVYSTEHIYDERTPGLKNFKLNGSDDFYPRLGILSAGDAYHTNVVGYDTTEFVDDAAFLAADFSTMIGYLGQNGVITLTAKTNLGDTPTVAPTKALGATEAFIICGGAITTMPSGVPGFKFKAIAASAVA